MKYELPEKIINLIDESIEKFGYNIDPSDDDVWEIAKNFDRFPHFENIVIELFYQNLIEQLPKKYKYDYYINGFDSHLYYYDENGDCYEITSLKDVINCEN